MLGIVSIHKNRELPNKAYKPQPEGRGLYAY